MGTLSRFCLISISCKWAAALVMGLALTGCQLGGSDGEDGTAGTPGTTVVAGSATTLVPTITGVSIPEDGMPVVSLTVRNEHGVPFAGLSQSQMRFSIAQLQTDADGVQNWQSYLNSEKAPSVATAPIVDPSQTQIQAGNENGGSFTDNGDGTYTYTFSKDITNITAPVAVTYDAGRTHRVGMQLSGVDGVAKPANATYTWVPSTGTAVIAARDMVKTESCNVCHSELTFHGARTEVKYCVTCHNPGSADPESGNTVDFKVMIHKLHRGARLPSVINGTPYSIWGYGGAEYAFSDLHFPQDIRNCTKCHSSPETALPAADNWKGRPTVEACGSCHDDIDFTTGANRYGGNAHGEPTVVGGVGPQDNAVCVNCHNGDGGLAGAVDADHAVPYAATLADVNFNILSVTGPGGGAIAAGSALDVTFEIRDAAGAPVTLGSLGPNAAVSVRAAAGEEFPAGFGVSADALAATDNLNGTYTATTTALPADATGAVTVTIYGIVSDADGRGNTGSVAGRELMEDNVVLTPPFETAAITSSTARRTVVTAAKCNQCHQDGRFGANHNGYERGGDPNVCTICHNPERTSSNAAYADNAAYDSVNGALNPDANGRSSTDFKRIIHGLHASASHEGESFREVPYRTHNVDFSTYRFPGKLNQCDTCHVDETYTLPLAGEVKGSKTSADGWITPTAAVCSSCHDDALGRQHMIDNGASFTVADPATIYNSETNPTGTVMELCGLCHSDGDVADVKTVHGIE